jgi:hypothetical protein
MAERSPASVSWAATKAPGLTVCGPNGGERLFGVMKLSNTIDLSLCQRGPP